MRCAAILACLPLIGTAPGPIDLIVIDKSRRTLALMHGAKPIRVYRGIKLGSAPHGHKHFEGDEKTPEGRYSIDFRNAASHYHLSLRLSYPNAVDRVRAARLGRAPGGNIFIHGQPNWSPLARIPYDWTDGCVALSNVEMDELWKLVRTGTPVLIRP